MDLRSQQTLRMVAVDFRSHWHQTGSIQAKETAIDEEASMINFYTYCMNTINVTNVKFILCQ